MDDISEKINALLSDEESMKQIQELAELLTGGSPDDNGDSSDGIESFDSGASDSIKNREANTPMPDFSGLTGLLSGGKDADGGADGFDIGTMMKLMSVLQTVDGKNDCNRNVLLALRPMLGADKQAKIDKAVKMLRVYALYNAIKDSGISIF